MVRQNLRRGGPDVRIDINLTIGFIVLACLAEAQPTKSLRQAARAMENGQTIFASAADSSTVKCGTPLIHAIRSQWNALSPQSRAELGQVLQRPTLQKSRLSPSGRFRVHYDTTGFNQPALIAGNQSLPNTDEAYIDSVRKILDYVYRIEIDSLGFEPPPSDGVQGDGPEYDVYVQELGQSEFGHTEWNNADAITNGANVRYPTFIVLDNDYLGFRTPGMDGLKVTCAHEFHHAVQLGAYGLWQNVPNNDFYFNELTSSWMEDVVYTDVNDYYYDIRDYFVAGLGGRGFRDARGQSYSFTRYEAPYYGYERSLWGHFLSKRFGRSTMREIWNGIKSAPFLQSAAGVFSSHGSDWNSEFSLFSYWNYHTADRADSVRFYPEGRNYPRFTPNMATLFSGSTSTIAGGSYPLSTAMYEFQLPQDTITAIVSNNDVQAILSNDMSARQITLTLTKGVVSMPHVLLSNGLTAGFSANDLAQWKTFYAGASTKTDLEKVRLAASPNPFRLTESARLVLPVDDPTGAKASVYVVSSSMTLAYTGEYDVKTEFGNRVVAIPARDIRNNVSSGIYFVIAKTAESEYQWKVAIIQ